MTDEKQESHVWQTQHAETVSKDAYDGVLKELFAVADELTTLRAERDRLREAAEMADEALKAAMIEVPRPPIRRKITDAREKLRAALSTKGDGDGD